MSEDQEMEALIESVLEEDVSRMYSGDLAGLKIFAQEWHKHMQRWRSLEELPENGQRIEICVMFLSGDIESYLSVFVEDAVDLQIRWGYDCEMDRPLYWRPLSPLPDMSNGI